MAHPYAFTPQSGHPYHSETSTPSPSLTNSFPSPSGHASSASSGSAVPSTRFLEPEVANTNSGSGSSGAGPSRRQRRSFKGAPNPRKKRSNDGASNHRDHVESRPSAAASSSSSSAADPNDTSHTTPKLYHFKAFQNYPNPTATGALPSGNEYTTYTYQPHGASKTASEPAALSQVTPETTFSQEPIVRSDGGAQTSKAKGLLNRVVKEVLGGGASTRVECTY